MAMEGVGRADEVEREENDSESQLLRDRFRLSAISIAEAEGSILYLSLTVLFCLFLT